MDSNKNDQNRDNSHSHPATQPAPVPEGKVPANWELPLR